MAAVAARAHLPPHLRPLAEAQPLRPRHHHAVGVRRAAGVGPPPGLPLDPPPLAERTSPPPRPGRYLACTPFSPGEAAAAGAGW